MPMDDLAHFQCLVFDCDGVILNSNEIKTQAFYDVARLYGCDKAQALKDYHVLNGGVSRYKKFEYFLTVILGKKLDQNELDRLLFAFAEEVKKSLLVADVAEGIGLLREMYKHQKWLVVSGGDQSELREVFKERGLDQYFDGGIFGSPENKDTILSREIKGQNIVGNALFIGDSKYDYLSSSRAGLDFLFVSGWSEVNDWQEFCGANKLSFVNSLSQLLDKE